MKRFKAGERVTYVDLFHAVVLAQHDNHVTLSYWGCGPKFGEQIIKRVHIQWVEQGWNDIPALGEKNDI